MFFPVCGHSESRGKIRKLLESILHVRHPLDAVSDDLPEILFQILPDDKHDFVESRPFCVKDRVIHDDLAVRAHFFQLFDTAAVAGTDPRRHDNKCSIHFSPLLLRSCGQTMLL